MIKHGLSYTRLYRIWHKMKDRCYNKNDNRYKNYGARGIKICEEWKNDFLSFYTWACNNGYKDTLSIDRIDNNSDYYPGNCRWTTTKEQTRNRTTNVWVEYKGSKKVVSDWCKELKLSLSRIRHTVDRYGLSYAEAFDRHLYYIYNKHKHCWEI